MSNARNLANLLGTATTVPSTKLAALTESNMPSGSVVQVISGYTRTNQENVTWNAAPGNSNQYGSAISNRTYVAARTLTFTPKFSNSILYCTGIIGWTSGNSYDTGARGVMITLNDTSAIEVCDYPWYSTASVDYSYPPADIVQGTFTLSSGASTVIRLRPYGYKESAGNGALRYKGHSLTVMEIKA